MEVSTEKSEIVTNSMNNVSADIIMNDQKLEEVTSFKYLGATCARISSASRNSDYDCLSNRQIKQDLRKQHRQLRKQCQFV